MSPKAMRCAIYTRKSTEEGLDQNFNSLDAQREACEAYIASQRHEGWKLISKRYDDGGFSGGNLQRPGLQKLLADISAGHIDVVVVYKIDRLTRSLMDFAKMVEIFDKQATSFISVTQHFNTTTSMGRLTLNVLLSFAQFEREVTGERIRDKVAASKVKGMWMGGPVPLGYDVKDRNLAVNAKEASVVLTIFQRYNTLGCVQKLKSELDRQGTTTKIRVSRAGNRSGGARFSRGALYHLLRNHLYRGEVHHAGKYYPGQHAPVVPKSLWDAVQSQLDTNNQAHKTRTRAKAASLLAGMIANDSGLSLTPTHTVRHGKRYRYYMLRGSTKVAKDGLSQLSVPAHDVEELVEKEWLALLTANDLDTQLGIQDTRSARMARNAGKEAAKQWSQMCSGEKRQALTGCNVRVEVGQEHISLHADSHLLRTMLLGGSDEPTGPGGEVRLIRRIKAAVVRLRGETRILSNDERVVAIATAQARAEALRTVALGRKWARELATGEIESLKDLAVREGRAESYLYDVLRAGCLSPRLIEALIEGRNLKCPDMATFKETFPVGWEKQASLLAR